MAITKPEPFGSLIGVFSRSNWKYAAVNVSSGTVQLKAEFPNADRKLWPGQFVDVVLTVGERPDSVVVEILPKFVRLEQSPCVLYPGDAGYADADPLRPGSRHRCWLRADGWHYERDLAKVL